MEVLMDKSPEYLPQEGNSKSFVGKGIPPPDLEM
jgi:hypothetical protein